MKPAAGGKVPKARSLASALRAKPRGKTRVVCQRGVAEEGEPLDQLRAQEGLPSCARRRGPRSSRQGRHASSSGSTAPSTAAASSRASRRRSTSRATTTASSIMPGKYLESKSRAKPTNDPKCAQYKEESDDGQGAATYRYQVNCPNDQNLIYLQGRALTDEPVPFPPRENRRGHPRRGPLHPLQRPDRGHGREARGRGDRPRQGHEGEAARPVRPAEGGRHPRGPRRRHRDQATSPRPMPPSTASTSTRPTATCMTHVKFFYNKEYGGLMFASDHGLTQRLRGRGPRRLGHLPGRRARHGRADHGAEGAREQHDHALRHPPQHARLLGHDGQRAPAS